jgi:hypothetical protein
VGSSSRKSSLSLLGLAACVVLIVSAPVALATVSPTQTREGYVAAVEPICKRNSEANSRILKGVKGQVKHDQLAPAGKRFIRASAALGKTVSQIAAAPQPTADAAKLTTWIGYLKKEKAYLQKIGGYLKAENKYQAQKQAVELNRNNNKANNTVISFGFKECKIDSSKFL